MQLPQMNPFPDVHSVLVMDNCRIHHTDMLQQVLNAASVSFSHIHIADIHIYANQMLCSFTSHRIRQI